jgi:hypothetical protein
MQRLIKSGESIMEELSRSLHAGTMLGLHLQSSAGQYYVIVKIQSISNDPADAQNRIIYLSSTDLHGNPVQTNPINLNRIVGVRRYDKLYGLNGQEVKM